MWELRGSRPRHCLKIGTQTIAWAERSKTWRGRQRYRCVLSPTPNGSVKLSPIDLNLLDRTTLEERVRSLAGPPRCIEIAGRVFLRDIPKRVTLLLPDFAVRTTIISLEQIPHRMEEQEALIRWRLGQDQRLSLAGTKLIWQVFPPLQTENQLQMVLVVAIQENILAQYESLCESAGLLPQEVGVTSLHVFNLWFKAAGGRKALHDDLAWISIFDGGLTCFIIHEGRPVFVRNKPAAGNGVFPTDDPSGESASKIVHEIGASVLACREYVPGIEIKRLVLAAADEWPELDDTLESELHVTVERVDWSHVVYLGWSHDGGNTSAAALPVVAGMIS